MGIHPQPAGEIEVFENLWRDLLVAEKGDNLLHQHLVRRNGGKGGPDLGVSDMTDNSIFLADLVEDDLVEVRRGLLLPQIPGKGTDKAVQSGLFHQLPVIILLQERPALRIGPDVVHRPGHGAVNGLRIVLVSDADQLFAQLVHIDRHGLRLNGLHDCVVEQTVAIPACVVCKFRQNP